MNPKEKYFFSQVGTNSKELGTFAKAFIYVDLYCSVQSVRYSTGTDFEEKNMGTIFEKEKNGHRNPYNLYYSVQFRRVCWA